MSVYRKENGEVFTFYLKADCWGFFSPLPVLSVEFSLPCEEVTGEETGSRSWLKTVFCAWENATSVQRN